MFKKSVIGVLLLSAGFVLGAFVFQLRLDLAPPAPPPPAVSNRVAVANRAFSEIVDTVSPAVVNIATVKVSGQGFASREDTLSKLFEDFYNPYGGVGSERSYREQNQGSGLIVSENGYIITNNHVVDGAEKITVTLYDKRIFSGEVVGADPKTDLAVVHIPSGELPVVQWGDSDRLRVGEFVLAIGNPFGLNHTVTMGIISAVGRADVGVADYEDFIQTDAAINPGNSGGALVSADGVLVGINTALFSKSGGYQGIGFAVPSNMARQVFEQLVSQGRVIRGWLGVTIQELTPDLAREFGHQGAGGALVGEVVSGSPASEAGIRKGDVVVEFAGKYVSGPSSLKNLVAQSTPGTKTPVKVLSDRKLKRLMVTVEELPQQEPEADFPETSWTPGRDVFSGLNVITLTKDVARQLSLAGETGGVVVVSVREGSSADVSGLRRGDVVQEIEGRAVRDMVDYQRITSDVQGQDAVLMYVNRGGRKFYLVLVAS